MQDILTNMSTVCKAPQTGCKLEYMFISFLLGLHQSQLVHVVALPYHGELLNIREQVRHGDGGQPRTVRPD